MWILVLTLWTFNSSGGQAIATVPGFTSERNCMVAANAWVERTKSDYRSPRALCVKA